ncbi:DUF3800 domain-containing protein [Dyella japonica]|uniref:DUF3800 domain-containing protein n=1 Tax=Dyella japonica A8 TaxID=1217721 RepID=A0A075K1W3_9GAMM|nr:DUF3800 domain-containing protein [Dyella japonica]AIF48199.1 hypothetical protein HY57_13510 [Dyella japonica A8]
MYFHIDESGNTGNNLFDPNQPRLSYGLLASATNVDARGQALHARMLKTLGEPTLHANVLGVERLTRIAPLLAELQTKMQFTMDYYFIQKPVYALVLLFDAVFDAGLNKAVKWDSYWTPLRFVLIHKLASIVSDDLLEEGWRLCTHKRITTQGEAIVALLTELRKRALASSLDGRSKEIMADAFAFGIAHPLELDFGTQDDKIMSPNAVCFQFVLSSMARRLRKKSLKDASSIIVDQQAQFNRAQIGTHYHQKLIAQGMKRASTEDRAFMVGHPLYANFGADEVLLRGMPRAEIQIRRSSESIGLQVVDIYLWITNRLLQDAPLSDELTGLGSMFLPRSFIDGISLEGMARRFEEFMAGLPEASALTKQQMQMVAENIAAHHAHVKTLGL